MGGAPRLGMLVPKTIVIKTCREMYTSLVRYGSIPTQMINPINSLWYLCNWLFHSGFENSLLPQSPWGEHLVYYYDDD